MQSDQHIDNFLSKHMMTGPKISYHEVVKGLNTSTERQNLSISILNCNAERDLELG